MVIVSSMEIRRALKTRVRVNDFPDMTYANDMSGFEFRTGIQNQTRGIYLIYHYDLNEKAFYFGYSHNSR